MGRLDNYTCDGQMNIFSWVTEEPECDPVVNIPKTSQKIHGFRIPELNQEYYDSCRGDCSMCAYNGNQTRCNWKEIELRYGNTARIKTCQNGNLWIPDTYRIAGMCGGCVYANFTLNTDAGDDHVYCLCRNDHEREHPYRDLEVPGFGGSESLGTNRWYRQMEYSRCAEWKPCPNWQRYGGKIYGEGEA